MQIFAIIAMSDNRVIGKQNQLPWHLPADLQHFKQLTMGKPILMGRRTYESIGKALPGRCNVVITHDVHFQAPGCVVANAIDTALAAVSYSEEVFVIGGAILLQQLMSRISRFYVTLIHHPFDGDTFFPELNHHEWVETEHINHPADEKNPYPYSFITFERKTVLSV